MVLFVCIRCKNLMPAGEACGHLTLVEQAGSRCPFCGGAISGMPVVYGIDEENMTALNRGAADRFTAAQPDVYWWQEDLLAPAEAGDPAALYSLGCLYALGLTPDELPDQARASRLMLRSAEAGLPIAQRAVAMRFLRGSGLPQDAKAAYLWMVRAAEQDEVVAQRELGRMCRYGSGEIPAQPGKAVEWFHRAAVNGDPEAMFQLAGCLFEGFGIARDDEGAIRFIAAAARCGLAEAQNLLGTLWESGTAEKVLDDGGVRRELNAAAAYLAAARQGHPDGQCNLARLHDLGAGVDPHPSFATVMYRFAAMSGDADAQLAYGTRLSAGYGVEQADGIEGLEWIRRSAAQGHLAAIAYLQQVGLPVKI